MTKTWIVFFVLISLAACGKSHSENPKMEMTDSIVALEFGTKIKLVNFETDEKEKILQAAELIKRVIASDEFKQEILNHEFNGKKAFSDNLGLTNSQIYHRIIQGSEKLTPGRNYKMDVTLVAYYEDSITVGYTYPDTHKIWMNRRFFGRNDAAEVTTNIVHEWVHKLGFDHATSPTPERRFSVPYAVGYIVRDLARNFLN